MVGIAFSILALIAVGGRRVTHLAFLGSDPIVLRFAGLRRLSANRTVVRWLKCFSSQALLALETLIRDLVHEQIERAKLSSLTLTVLRTGAKVASSTASLTRSGASPRLPDSQHLPRIPGSNVGSGLARWTLPCLAPFTIVTDRLSVVTEAQRARTV